MSAIAKSGARDSGILFSFNCGRRETTVDSDRKHSCQCQCFAMICSIYRSRKWNSGKGETISLKGLGHFRKYTEGKKKRGRKQGSEAQSTIWGNPFLEVKRKREKHSQENQICQAGMQDADSNKEPKGEKRKKYHHGNKIVISTKRKDSGQ